MKKYYFFIVVALFGLQSFFAQVKSTNENVWLHYVGKNMLTKKLSFTLEATMRYADGFNQKQQYFIRPSVDYQFTKSFNGSIGYSHYETYSYGEVPMNKITTPEDHIWIQGTYAKTCGDYKFTHRLRDEHRWVGISGKNANGELVIMDKEYRNRLRYMFLVNYTLTKKDDKPKLFALAGDEVFMNIGVENAKTFVQQNRVIAGLGYNINAHHQLQVSYVHQNVWNLGNTIQENNPTVRLSYLTNFDWYKKND
ncbi:DUF2490 domain-containing protein [Flavobacterium sp.]|uniref:DUF2490 domain-containing protein n=1 Tax=Flavobacterium sp. TaxID=239 RepID=UPI003D0D2075